MALSIVPNTRTLNISGGSGTVQFRKAGDPALQVGPPLVGGRAKLINLTPGTAYEVVVGGQSQIVSTRSEQVPKAGGQTLDADPSTLVSLLSGLLPGDTLRLRGGTYRIPAAGIPISRSGAPDNYITIENYPGEEPVLTGDLGLSLSWSLYQGTIWQATLPAGVVAENVWDGDSFLWWYSSLAQLQNPTYGPGGFCQVGTTLYVRLQDDGDPGTRQMHISPQDPNWRDRYGKLLVVTGNYLEIKGLVFKWVSTPIRLSGQWCVIDGCQAMPTHFLVETATGSAGNIVRNCEADGGPSYDVYGRYTYGYGRPDYGWKWPHGRAIWWHDNAVSFEAYGNRFTRFTEGISGYSYRQENNAAVNCNVDLYDNEVSYISDDAFEVDGAGVSFGMWGNYIHHNYDCLSLAPIKQGPGYIFKNTFAFSEAPVGVMATWIKTGADSQNALVFIFHNTVYLPARGEDVSNGISSWASGAPPQLLMWNNIISVSYKITTAGWLQHREDYNILWTTSTGKFWTDALTYWDIAGLRAGTGFEVRGFQVDPGFANPAGGDFTPSQGANLGTAGPLLDQDVSYFERAIGYAGAAPDMGAIEVGGPAPEPTARFSATPLTGYAPLTVQFADESTGPIYSWDLDFGDGSPHSPTATISHIYASSGVYTATLVVNGPGGSNSYSQTIQAQQLTAPIAGFTADKDQGVVPLTVRFTDTSEPGSGITRRTWNYGNGSPEEVYTAPTNPSHVFSGSGSYTVRLLVEGPGGSSAAQLTITVLAAPLPPVADFDVSASEGVAPLTVQFTDRSEGEITSRLWDFGDGQTTTVQNPTCTYTEAGQFTATLTVTGPGGTDDFTRLITVHTPPPPPPVPVGTILTVAGFLATLLALGRRR